MRRFRTALSYRAMRLRGLFLEILLGCGMAASAFCQVSANPGPVHNSPDEAKRESKFQSIYWPAERKGEEALKKADYAAAKKSLLVARAAARDRGDSKWLELATTLSELGTAELAEQNLEAAEQLYKESLDLHEKHQKPDEAEVGGALQSLASVYMEEDHLREAEPLIARSVDIYKARITTIPSGHMAEAKADYGRHIALGSFLLAAIGARTQREEMARARCADAVEYGKQWLQGREQGLVMEKCGQILVQSK